MLVVVAAIFLIILTGALYTYLKNNVDTQIWTRDRMQARFSAEAAINLATHMLVSGASLPDTLAPTPILGTMSSFETCPGAMGSAFVTVDPNDSNYVVTSANAFMLRCIAEVQGSTTETYGMEAVVMPENLARFSVFMDDPSTDGYYADGYRFDGPFYANGPVCIYSSSPTHQNDPLLHSLQLTSDYYIYGTGAGGSHETTPAAGNLQMQPYNRLMMGSPYFELGIEPIPFGSDELDWEGVRTAAQNGGLVLDLEDGARIRLEGDSTMVVRRTAGGADETYDLATLDNPVVWIANEDDERVYLSGDQFPTWDMSLTIGLMGSLYMSGPLLYANREFEDPDNKVILGLMCVRGDLIIADDPDGPEPGWEGFQIFTDVSFEFDAVIVTLDGVLEAEKYWEPLPAPGTSKCAQFTLLGGYMIQEEGYTGTSSGQGFDISVWFDPRLLTMHPPYFPTTANWNTVMWSDRPDMTPEDVDRGLYQPY